MTNPPAKRLKATKTALLALTLLFYFLQKYLNYEFFHCEVLLSDLHLSCLGL